MNLVCSQFSIATSKEIEGRALIFEKRIFLDV